MKAAAIIRTNELRLIEVETPHPVPDQVLVQVAYCGICATDYDNYRGTTSFAKNGQLTYPLRFGHEWSGRIVEIGSEVTDFRIGDKVIGDGKVTCDKCENCRAGRWFDCKALRAVGTVKDHWPGAMAEYILMPARNVFRISEDVPLKEAALCEPVTIAMNGLRETKIDGSTVLVIGSGPIAMGGIAAAKALGAKRIICAARKPFKLERAKQMGATDVIDVTAAPLTAQLTALNGGEKADVVLETTGCTDYVEDMMNLTANMGTLSLVGFYDRPIRSFDLDTFIYGKAVLRGSSGSREFTPKVAELINAHRLNLLPMLTHEIDFSDIESAMDFYAKVSGERIKILVKIAGEI